MIAAIYHRETGMSLRSRFMVGALTFAFGAGCSDRPTSPGEEVEPLRVSLSVDSVYVGTSAQLHVVARDPSVSTAALQMAFETSDSLVAKVDANGVVSGVSDGDVEVLVTTTIGTARVEIPVRLRHIDIGVEVTTVSRASWAVCVLSTGGEPYCDSGPPLGKLPNFTRVPDVPEQLTSISVGLNSFCGRGFSGRLICWGRNGYGQFGFGATGPDIPTPTFGAPGFLFEMINTGGHSAVCGALKDTQVLHCWGHNDFNQTGRLPTGQAILSVAPVEPELRVQDVSLSGASGCAIDIDGAAWCWGGPASGFPGMPAPLTPRKLEGTPESFVSVEAGQGPSCALTADGAVWCWGSGVSNSNMPPTRVLFPQTFVQLSTNEGAMCGVTNKAEAWCWNRVDAPPYPFVRKLPVRKVVNGLTRRCVITTSNRLYCT
jgi:hypothetical protein